MAIARKVFDAFFLLYPYCYGYWKKYADLEHRLSGTQAAKQVSVKMSIILCIIRVTS